MSQTKKIEFFPFPLIAGNVEGLHARHGRTSRVIYITIVLGLLAAVAALPLIEVEVSSRARGVLRPELKLAPVSLAIGGKVDEVRLEEDLKVCAGDTLLVLSQRELNPETELLEEQLRERNQLIRDLRQLTALKGDELPTLETAVYQRDFQDFSRQLDEAKLKFTHAERQLKRQRKLLDSETISRMEYEEAEFNFALTQGQWDRLGQQQRHLWTQELQRIERERRDLVGKLSSIDQRATQYVVTAPVDGSLAQTPGIQPGAFVAPGQSLGMISPDGALRVETYVSPSDIGLLREGMTVNLQLDAFNHHQWGLAHATVESIGRDVTEFDGGAAFRVVCTLETSELRLKSGYAGRLRKGMMLTAHFQLTRRTLFELMHDKLDDWFAPQYY